MCKFNPYDKNKEISVFRKVLLFSIAFALLFKWWLTGNPFQPSTIVVAIVMLLQLLVSLYIGKKIFVRFMSMPIEQIKKRIIPCFLLFLLLILFVCLIIMTVVIFVANRAMGVNTDNFIQHLLEVEFPDTIKYYIIFASLGASSFFYTIWRHSVDKEEQLQKVNLETLNPQVNSHLLFSSQNTLPEIAEPDELKHTIDNFKPIHQSDSDHNRFESIIRHIHPRHKERFLIRIGEHYKSITTSDISAFYILERSTFLLTNSGKSYPVDYSLEQLEQSIDPGLFFRVNRHFIINFSAIQDVIIYSSSRLKLDIMNWTEKEAIIVSRERVADFKKWMNR